MTTITIIVTALHASTADRLKHRFLTNEILSFSGLPCVLPREGDSVLVGSAILGACAAGDFSSVQVNNVH